METNGKTLPQITVGWDASDQTVHINAADTAFRNLDFVCAILQMAIRRVEVEQRFQALQLAQATQRTGIVTPEEETAIRRTLRR